MFSVKSPLRSLVGGINYVCGAEVQRTGGHLINVPVNVDVEDNLWQLLEFITNLCRRGTASTLINSLRGRAVIQDNKL